MQLDPSAFIADPELVSILEEKSKAVDCGEDRVLFLQGESSAGLYIVEKGAARLKMDSPEGKPIFEIRAAQGSLLGLPGLLGDQPYTLTATAEAGAKVGFISRDKFTALMQSEPKLALKILAVLAAEVRSARRAIG